MEISEFFDRNPVFTLDEFLDTACEEGSPKRESAHRLLHYHKDQGHIVKIKKNLYASIPPGRDPEKYPVDPYLIAGYMNDDAVVGYHTALELHGHAHTVHHRYLYLTERSTHSFTFRRTTFQPVSVPRSLVENEKQTLEVEDTKREGCTIRVTCLERTLVDLLDRPKYSGGWEDIWRSFRGVGYLKFERLIEYLRVLDNQTTAAKIGFFLDQHREELSVREEDLEQVEELIPGQPRYMDRDLGEGTMQSRWNLIVPDYVLERKWRE